MPMTLSLMDRVSAAVSGTIVTESVSAPRRSGLASASKRSFSQASEALEISSRRNISLCEYSEWITNRNTCLVSAWNSLICGCVSVVMALQYVVLRRTRTALAFREVGPVHDSSRRQAYGQDRKFQDGENRHQCSCLGSAGGERAGGRRQVRRRRRQPIGRHAERGRAITGRQPPIAAATPTEHA